MLSLFSLSTSLPNERARKFVLKNEGFLHSIEFCSISGLKCYSAMASSDCWQCCHGDRGLLFQQGTASPFPLSEHLYPCPMRCHFNFFFKNQFNSYCLPNMKAFLGKKSICFTSQILHMSWIEEKKELYQTKGCYFWNTMCSFQQGRRLHLLSSDMLCHFWKSS